MAQRLARLLCIAERRVTTKHGSEVRDYYAWLRGASLLRMV